MEKAPDGPYIYQPFGSVSHPQHAAAGRLWAIGGLHHLATLQGLTRQEAELILGIVKRGRHEHAK